MSYLKRELDDGHVVITGEGKAEKIKYNRMMIQWP